jgi:hypothetical protein
MAKKDESCPCMDGVAKIQTRNTLVSWYNKANEEIAVLEKNGQVPKDDIENKKIILNAVKNEIERIDDLPICEDTQNANNE